MATYKVPQDVEAEDKLIGPFSFRQFIYLIIAVIGIALGWGLSQLFLPLAIIPLPIVLFFGALALPLRKDQPMEVYLAAVVSFYLKPRRRLWLPDGIQSLVEITAPKTIEVQRSKNISEAEAEQRLSYLANIVDTGGWAVRGVEAPVSNAMRGDAYFEAQQAQDVLDTAGGVARAFDTRLTQADTQRRQEVIERMHQAPPTQPTAPPVPDPYTSLAPSQPAPIQDEPDLIFNPYPTSIHQSVVQPLNDAEKLEEPQIAAPIVPQPTLQKPQEPTSEERVSPDIINLANNPDLSIETIAHEAHRIQEKEEKSLPEDEVVISLR